MTNEFTPGEWKQSHRKIPNNKKEMYATQIHTEDGETIATLSWYPKPQEKGIHEGKPILITGTYRDANAKLIASAPKLFEALTEVAELLDETEMDVNSFEFKLWKICNDALGCAVL
jgi:hypothetical protein